MFGWCDEDGGSKIFWFEETKAGYQKLVRPDGTSRIIKEKNDYFCTRETNSIQFVFNYSNTIAILRNLVVEILNI